MCVDSWLPEKPSPAAAARSRAAAASSRAASARVSPVRLPPFLVSAVKWLIKNVLPKRKTLVRATLFAFIGIFPFLLILMLHRPLLVVPFLGIIAALGYAAGLGEETSKQLRWMRRMSGRGPIFWAIDAGHRLLVRAGRRFYGDRLDQPPKPPLALGTASRGAERAKIKWIPQPTSSFSREKYEVQVRATALAEADSAKEDADASERGWVSLSDNLEMEELVLAPLHPSTRYEARVRAVNSKGASEWRSVGFTTKQKPALIDDGTRALARGDGYTWAQVANRLCIAHAPPLRRAPANASHAHRLCIAHPPLHRTRTAFASHAHRLCIARAPCVPMAATHSLSPPIHRHLRLFPRAAFEGRDDRREHWPVAELDAREAARGKSEADLAPDLANGDAVGAR